MNEYEETKPSTIRVKLQSKLLGMNPYVLVELDTDGTPLIKFDGMSWHTAIEALKSAVSQLEGPFDRDLAVNG